MCGGVFLRFQALEDRPFHADEATGARITATRMESGGGTFDPKHYHGPLLADFAIPLCKARGETSWDKLEEHTLRLIPAVAGSLLLLIPLAGRRRVGDWPMWLAAALLASSPLLVYYSRMFIHEMLLALFGAAFLGSLLHAARYGLPGFWLGLMFATKETFAISVLAWSMAGVVLAWENRKRLEPLAIAKSWRVPIVFSLLTFLLSAGFLYTDGFQYSRGALDAVRTFFVYETVEGHDKPLDYYMRLLALPQKAAGVWWFSTPVILLAIWAYASTFGKCERSSNIRLITRFLAYSAVGHLLIYSLFGYKTPWLVCLLWVHICLLAGISLTHISQRSRHAKRVLITLCGIAVITQFHQARSATGRLVADPRNPFAYVPTSRDIVRLESWLGELAKIAPGNSLEPVAVIGRDYWPLPWYLRSFDKVGYWKEPPPELPLLPLVFAMPEHADSVALALAETHTSLPRGLRAGVPLQVSIRNDLWKLWMNTEQ